MKVSMFDYRLRVLTKKNYIYPMLIIVKRSIYRKYFDSLGNLRPSIPTETMESHRYGVIEQGGIFISTNKPVLEVPVLNWIELKKQQLKKL